MAKTKPDSVELDRRLTAEADLLIPVTADRIRKARRAVEQNARHLERHPRRSHLSRNG